MPPKKKSPKKAVQKATRTSKPKPRTKAKAIPAPTNIPLTSDAKLLLVFMSLRTIFELFTITFFVSFIMQNSANEIFAVSVYNLFWFFVSAISLFVVAGWVKRKNKVAVFRLTAIPNIILFSIIVFLGDTAVEKIIPLGILLGISDATYWLPMHRMIGEKVDTKAMTKFHGYRSMINQITMVSAPVILGLFITVGSYEQMAKALLVLCIVELILSFFLSPSFHRSKNKPDIAGFYRCMLQYPVIRKQFFIELLRGFSWGGALPIIITMYVVWMFKTDFMLGMFTTVFAIFTIITSFLFGRFGKKSMFPRILALSMIGATGSMALFVANTNATTFLIYNFVFVTIVALSNKITLVNTYNLSKASCVSRDHKVEYFVFRDLTLCIGGIISFVGLLAIGTFGGYEWLRWYMIPLTLSIVWIGYASIKINGEIK